MTFAIDDEVRVAKLHNSGWHGLSGGDTSAPKEEYAVRFKSHRLLFPTADLVQEIPENAKRFFKAEVMSRWPDVSPDDVIGLNAERNDLIRFLQQRYDF